MSIPFAALKYLKIDPNISDHPKILALSEALDEPRHVVIGRWILIQSWAAKYATDGIVSRYSSKSLANACDWEKDPQTLVLALISVGLCDEYPSIGTDIGTDLDSDSLPKITIHGWDEWYDDVASSRIELDGRSFGGRLGNHKRWHAGIISPTCSFCIGTESVPINTESDTDIDIVKDSKVKDSRVKSDSPKIEMIENAH